MRMRNEKNKRTVGKKKKRSEDDAAARLEIEKKKREKTLSIRTHRPFALSSFMRPLTETRVAAAAAGAAAEAMTEERERGGGRERMSDTDVAADDFVDAAGLVDAAVAAAARFPDLATAAADGAASRGAALLETKEAELVLLLLRLHAQPRMSRKEG